MNYRQARLRRLEKHGTNLGGAAIRTGLRIGPPGTNVQLDGAELEEWDCPLRYHEPMGILSNLSYNGRLTHKARRLIGAGVLSALSIAVFLIGLYIASADAPGVVGGFLLGLCPTGITASVAYYRTPSADQQREIYTIAETEVLHERLNELAEALQAPTVDVISGELDARIRERAERIAHFAGLDEHRQSFMDPSE